ncbi:MAG: hypothetical protein N2556_04180 [Anaerolineae bacterium]|nr:hypothetical protein [Anaerolineae bacterium]
MNDCIGMEGTVMTVWEGAEQWILLPPTPAGEALARLLGGEVTAGEDGRIAVRHDREVDRRLVALIDLLIRLRWAHPVFVQLELEGVG